MASRFLVALLTFFSLPAIAAVTGVTIVSQKQAAGSYEELTGRIQFALDPADAHNRGIVDLENARRDGDGLVRFAADLHVLRPADPSKANGVLLFGIANRGRGVVVERFGEELLMRDGYTIVSVGWELDTPAPLLSIDAPAVELPSGADDRVAVELMYNTRVPQGLLIDDPAGRPPVIYPPRESAGADDVLTV